MIYLFGKWFVRLYNEQAICLDNEIGWLQGKTDVHEVNTGKSK